eukprot:GILI01025589.1.p1 GENE.GILI01025589.1~~GILI01025589.1.p1  ORF type:complete len:520 (+),score=75.50 GILI01025589.1:102-1661(+)
MSTKKRPVLRGQVLSQKEVYIRNGVLGLGLCLSLCAGTLDAFGVWNKQVKEIMHYSTSEINLISSLGSSGIFIGFPAGIIFDKFGPKVCALYASFLTFIGYFLIYLQVKTQFIQSFWFMGACLFLAGHGSVAMYFSGMLTNARNFPEENRGLIVGLSSAGFGLSGAVFANIYKSLFLARSDVLSFLLLVCILLSAMSLICFFFVKFVGPPVCPPSQSTLPTQVDTLRQPLLTVVEDGHSTSFVCTSSETSIAPASPVSSVSAMSPNSFVSPISSFSNDSIAPATPPVYQNDSKEPFSKPIVPSQPPCIDISGWALIKNTDYIVLWVALGLVMGAGLMLISNLSFLAQSNRLDENQTLWLVSGFSYTNCLGRVLAGLAADKLSRSFSRPFFILVATVVMFCVQLLLAFQEESYLYPASVIGGLVYGACQSTGPAFVSERFGVKNFGANWGLTTLSLAIGGTIFNQLAGVLYDSNYAPDSHVCYGLHCFQLTFLVTSACCVLSGLLMLILIFRVKKSTQIM